MDNAQKEHFLHIITPHHPKPSNFYNSFSVFHKLCFADSSRTFYIILTAVTTSLTITYEIWGSHSGEDVDDELLG
jgi:hypothetical protein